MSLKSTNQEVNFPTSKLFIIQTPKLYTNPIEVIPGKLFSRKEIDVIACIISGRTSKIIASLLSIPVRTVDSRINNIMSKLESHSRNNIIDLIEKSGKYNQIKEHYFYILMRTPFEKFLKETGKVLNNNSLQINMIVTNKKDQNTSRFIQQVSMDLENIGITLVITENKSVKKPQESIENNALIKSTENNLPLTFLLARENEISSFEINSNFELISPEIHLDYYYLFFEILKKVGPSFFKKFNELFLDFKEEYEKQMNAETSYLNLEIKNKEKFNRSKENIKFFGVFILSAISIIFCFFPFHQNILSSFKEMDFNLNNKEKRNNVIADLSIPHPSILLSRSNIITDINSKLNDRGSFIEAIPSVVLVGMGGSGKTTLARQYARIQKDKVIWEINAESKETVMNSFKDLASVLASTEISKKELKELQETTDLNEREKRLIFFVKNNLKNYPQWLLIYDNVESLNDIISLFPHNREIWGNGKIIITTKDNNIGNNNYINANNIIQVKELSKQEMMDLFLNIQHGNGKKLTPLQYIKAEEFIQELTPFPLDISTAAYYMKNTNIPYSQYLERIKFANSEFNKMQEIILKENSNYLKTRYNMIKLTLQKLIDENPDFADLLLLISLIDSQNIPIKLLESCKENTIVEQFIHALRKYSLIDVERNQTKFSIHKNIQEVCLAYLLKTKNSPKDNPTLGNIIEALENYIIQVIHEDDFFKMRNVVAHCERILKNNVLLNNFNKGVIQTKLGGLYFHLMQDTNITMQILEQGIANLTGNIDKNSIRRAFAMDYMGRLYDFLNNYEKAKNLLQQSILIYKKNSVNSVALASALGRLSMVFRNLGNYETGIQLLQQSLDIYKMDPAQNQSGIAWTNAFLGIIYRDLGNYGKAAYFLERGLLLYKTHFGEEHNRVGWALAWLGRVYKEIGDYSKAQQTVQQSLIIKNMNFSPDHSRIAWVQEISASIFTMIGSYEKANQLLEKNLLIYNKNLSSNLSVAASLEGMGILYRHYGDYDRAKSLLQKSMDLMQESSKNPLWNADTLSELGILYYDLGDYAKAERCLKQCIQIYEDNPAHNGISFARHLGYLGRIQQYLGKHESAKDLLEKNLAAYEKHFGRDHIEVARILRNLAELHLSQEMNIEVAEGYLTNSLSILQKYGHPERFLDLELLAELNLKKLNLNNQMNITDLQNKEKALKYLKQALRLIKTRYPENSSHLARIRTKIKNLSADNIGKSNNF